ncbi:hypothetical protein H0H93_007494 [Arthromyces matolae]|nr:hypothetical protein H0H93_007494 [Arthromyces matolae]
MLVNALATESGFRVGPVVLETLVKHYFDKHRKTADGHGIPPLRQDELMYDEVFNVVKIVSAAFANTRTPSPPSIHVVRLLIPMSTCDEAAKILVAALGGEEVAKRVVGGVKWWQVRGVNGVDAQWITARKDWENAKRRHKMHERAKASESVPSIPADDALPDSTADTPIYEQHMDEMRCILYSHGGGYYFGSVDQERYSIQRHARKINGRVFAVNYRLAPQYPFPCALQDLIAAYLYLIRPPQGAAHRPVDPAHVIIAGDSAGGGLSLALLQVIRDSGLPLPAGGVLISPWCDFTHSFPSIHTNTATDVLPEWGLSVQKPSVLWPPPPDELSNRVHASLRSRIREVFRSDQPYDPTATMLSMAQATPAGHPIDVGTTISLPTSDPEHQSQTVSLVARSGETLTTNNQLHLYTQNSLLMHPLVSPVLSYLGGLPPLLFIASDREVLRDEVIYAAHKAANPEKYPIKTDIRALYPALNGIEGRFKPTKVHLQVYDDTAHVLPVLFPFTTPAKYCFRAIATFCKHVTGMDSMPNSPSIPSKPSLPNLVEKTSLNRTPNSNSMKDFNSEANHASDSPKRKSLRRSLSSSISKAIRSRPRVTRTFSEDCASLPTKGGHSFLSKSDTDILNGPLISQVAVGANEPLILSAGDPRIYNSALVLTLALHLQQGKRWDGTMIRERISTRGLIRPLEPESELGALTINADIVGRLSELALRRYLDANAMFDKKFAHTIRTIEKDRRRNLKLAKKDTKRDMHALQQHLTLNNTSTSTGSPSSPAYSTGSLTSSDSWNWAWALDGDERPPPSSIVSRRDTSEARRLAKIADQCLLQSDQALSGNRFWSAVINFFSLDQDQIPNDVVPKKKVPLFTNPLRGRKKTSDDR